MNKPDLTLNNVRYLIFHKPNQTKPNQSIFRWFCLLYLRCANIQVLSEFENKLQRKGAVYISTSDTIL